MVWSLKDINFEIEQGDAVGIIGRNGAGKSTLLKILSRVTSPTTGSVKIKGRIASLLEVGTGFHPELTGRENIYLNGAILGMRKAEIKRKFDEIVDFSGVERYIDTPVKRYSSGMYVRLAFAVAAYLESEILVVDEVLAVGDAEFQKKCLGKMGDVSKGEGRTVLFVSHNMEAVKNLCNKAICLDKGGLLDYDNSNVIIDLYVKKNMDTYSTVSQLDEKQSLVHDICKIEHVMVSKANETNNIDTEIYLGDPIKITIEIELLTSSNNISLGIELFNQAQVCVFKLASMSFNETGRYTASCIIPPHLLNDDVYSANIYVFQNRSVILKALSEVLQFRVIEKTHDESWYGKWIGVVRPVIPINIQKR